MRQLVFLLMLSEGFALKAVAQDAVVEAVTLSGIAADRVSSTLTGDIGKLIGQKFDSKAADEIADRMQSELPEYVAAARTRPGSQPDSVVLVFVVAPISEEGALGANVNARYPIDAVEIEGAPRSKVSDALYADMQKMVGQGLNNEEAEKLRERLATELGASYHVSRKVERSFKERQLKIIYEAFRLPWLPIRDPESFAAYHSQQGFSFSFNTGVGFKQRRVQNLSIGITNDGDTLIERFAGFRVGYENVRLGTDHLGLRLNYGSYRNQWSVHTVSPDLYRRRRNLEASLSFAFSPNLHVTTGISASELEMLEPVVDFKPSRAGTGAVQYERKVESGEARHEVEAGYEVHAAAHTLESDFVYTRHLWDGRYVFRYGEHGIRVSGMAGRITGNAPMFERFSLGDTRTLRGWNKFDFAPLGGDRVAYGSFAYHYNDVQVFYDVGSVWDSGSPVKIRPSIGFGLGEQGEDDFFLGVAIPFRESGMRPAFLLVCRFKAF